MYLQIYILTKICLEYKYMCIYIILNFFLLQIHSEFFNSHFMLNALTWYKNMRSRFLNSGISHIIILFCSFLLKNFTDLYYKLSVLLNIYSRLPLYKHFYCIFLNFFL